MRHIFLALVLANLAFAAWHAWFAEPERTIAAAPADVPGITLVSELPPAAQAAIAPSGVSPSSSRAFPALGTTSDERCISVGPFRELAQAATAAATLRTSGYLPAQRVAEGDVWIGYWVYIDSIPTDAEADEVLAKIRATGVTDAYIIPDTDSGNLVSLGVFSEISGVTRRRDDVRALGYEPIVVDRTRRATVYWVDVMLGPEQQLELDALQTPGRIIRLEQRVCDAAPG